jgi:hypothetical protein
MNMHDAGVLYIPLPASVLRVSRKTELLHAIEIYRRRTVEAASADLTPWQRRQRRESVTSLQHLGVLQESEENPEKLKPLVVDDSAKERITIPAEYDYGALSLVAIKTLLACHAHARYSRTPFRFTVKVADLAKLAQLSERRLRDGLQELQRHRFLTTEKHWRTGTRITLHEPNSDTPLFWLAEYHRAKRNAVPVCDRYKYLLGAYDPKGKLASTVGPVTAYKVTCPFCRSHRDGPTFNFTSTDEDDHWICYNCRRRGKSAYLWAKLSNWDQRTDWRSMLSEVGQPAQLDGSMNHVKGEHTNQ